MKNSDEYISDFPFYPNLSDEEIKYVKNNSEIRAATKGEMLYGCGKVCMGMSHIISGSIRVYIVSEEGREITLYTLNKGDNCVMSASCVISQLKFETVMMAQENCEMLILNSGALSQLSENNIYVKEMMYEMLAMRFSQVMQVMQEILFYGFDRRLARYFVEEYEKTGNLTISITQEKLAQNVNSAREVVTRMLKRFSNEGIIDVKHGCIVIKDIEALKLLR